MANLTLPNTLTNGTTADATEVQDNFNAGTNYINARNAGSTDWDFVSSSGLITAKANINANDGSSSSPSYGWTSDTNTGIYRSAAETIAFSANGTIVGDWTTDLFQVWGNDAVIKGTRLANSRAFSIAIGDTSGRMVLKSGPNGAGEATNTAFDFSCDSPSSDTVIASVLANGQWKFSDGSVTAPAVSFLSDTNSGMYWISADAIGFSTGGSNQMTIENSVTTMNNNTRFPDGTLGVPSISFANDTDSGIYSIGANRVGISCGGTLILDCTSTRILIPDGSTSGPGMSFSNDSDTGFYLQGTNSIGVVGGTFESVRFPQSGNGDGSSLFPIRFYAGGGGAGGALGIQTTTAVSTSAKTIGTANDSFMIVVGDDGSNNRFKDFVSYTFNVSPTVLHSTTTEGSPSSRTYSNSAGVLQLQMGSGSYSVAVTILDGARR